MADLFDLSGTPELVDWAKRLGPAPRGGFLTATPAAAASRFGMVQVSGLAAGKGFYLTGASVDGTAGIGPARVFVSPSGLITENQVDEAANVSAHGRGASMVSAQSGRTAVTPVAGFRVRNAPAGTASQAGPVVFAAPVYVPPGSVAGVILDTANQAGVLSLSWLEAP